MKARKEKTSPSHLPDFTDNQENKPLEFGERVYRSFPAPLINALLHTKGVGHPTAMVECVQGSTGIPGFEEEEFAALMRDMNVIADRATVKLYEIAARKHRNTKRISARRNIFKYGR